MASSRLHAMAGGGRSLKALLTIPSAQGLIRFGSELHPALELELDQYFLLTTPRSISARCCSLFIMHISTDVLLKLCAAKVEGIHSSGHVISL